MKDGEQILNDIYSVITEVLKKLNSNPNWKQFEIRYTLQIYSKNQKIRSECNTISFKNQGDATININGAILLPGSSMLTFGNDVPQYDTTTWNIIFDTTAGSVKNLLVVRKQIMGKNSYYNTLTPPPVEGAN